MHFDILTLFPEMFAPINTSILGRAQKKGLIEVNIMDIREFSRDKHKKVDDYSYGGGPGMVMTADPIFRNLEYIDGKKKKIIYMSPRGKIMGKEDLDRFSKEDNIIILCGHYEGIDQRILDYWDVEELSIGDYVLTGGELPAMVFIDSLSRLIPGVLSNEDGAIGESIYSGLLEFPQYTKPRDYRNLEVPEILLSGDHEKIDMWRFEQSLILTAKRRPDLFQNYLDKLNEIPKNQRKVMEKVLEML